MSQCAVVGDGNVLVVTNDPPESCAGFIVQTQAEIAAQQSIFVPLSIDDGQTIGVSVLLCWAGVWVFRILRRFIEDWNVTGG
jgi:hypothetical protein